METLPNSAGIAPVSEFPYRLVGEISKCREAAKVSPISVGIVELMARPRTFNFNTWLFAMVMPSQSLIVRFAASLASCLRL